MNAYSEGMVIYPEVKRLVCTHGDFTGFWWFILEL
jgi:hypothetical protein